MPIIGESAGFIGGSQFGGGYQTPAFTGSVEVLTPGPGVNISVHTVLTRVAAAESIIGVASFRTIAGGTGTSFGIPESWAPMVFVTGAKSVIVGISVARGAARGYWMVFFW